LSLLRQDAWTQEEDVFLAETVLSHIRDGSTQLQAFEQVGKKLNRTAAACGFRWNSFVRKQYQTGIELAKQQRKQVKAREKKGSFQEHSVVAVSDSFTPDLGTEKVLAYISQALREAEHNRKVLKENKLLQEEIETLKEKLRDSENSFNQLKEKYKHLEDEYRMLLVIFEKARKLTDNGQQLS